ncbi:hypothetical protein JVT61DRAFT_11370 [Boletus reticuloceps]|uniref:Uncharacterized protein n=1 Tax=Boletus reticuloceps TaxID=495285 RepID=A0A8I2YEV0_9AGAM|nr:hypothetical protein JVT61DRAFT_11370 [Boletus reticuloceps]
MHPHQNPHDVHPPDFHSDKYAPSRQNLVNTFHITQEVAAQQLLDLWRAQNVLDRQEWDDEHEHVAAQELQRREQARQEREEAEHRQQEEEDEARKEERKKHRTKFLPFADVPPPLTIPITPSPLALRKLQKGEYIPLYFFTNKGLADAQSVSHSVDDEAYAVRPEGEDGLHAFVSIAAAKIKPHIIVDQDLTWSQIDEATHRMLQAMKEAHWPADRVDAMFQFWMNLASHEW